MLVPATACLGLPYQVIQIVMNWDGYHLHAFFVGNEHYGDPFYSPDLDVGATYPVCVTSRGDFPIEYWTDEDDDQEPIPFDTDKVNSRLADVN